MQEIKAITRHTHTKETAPLQPKTRDKFTSVLDELLGAGESDPSPAAKNSSATDGQNIPARSAIPFDGKQVPAPFDSNPPRTQTGKSINPDFVPTDALTAAAGEVKPEGTAGPAVTTVKEQKPSESGKTVPADASSQLPTCLTVSADLPGFSPVKPLPDSPKAVEGLTSLDVDPQLPLKAPTPTMVGTPAELVLKTPGSEKSEKPEKNVGTPVPEHSEDVSRFPVQFADPAMAAQPHHAATVRMETESAQAIPETADPSAISETDQQTSERLTLGDFGVTRFEFKTEIEPRPFTLLQSSQILQMVRTPVTGREIKAVKLAGSDSDATSRDGNSPFAPMAPPAAIAAPEAAEHVRLVFEPPAPPPVVRSVSMDIGDAESQVRVVIRERNGSLNVQFAAGSEHLRQDLQTSGSLLMRELQRNNPASVTLDFTNFGSATESDSQSRSQSEAKKQLKSGADFADAVESAYLPAMSSPLNSL